MVGVSDQRELCCRFTIDELRQARQAALEWAVQAGLGEERAADFVLALNEITTNAIRHGSPAASLRLHLDGHGGLLAEVSDSGHWPAQPGPPPDAGTLRGLALARRLCEQVSIGTGPEGTTVTLQMTAPPAARGPGPGCGTSGHRPG